ncbi:pseudaminic acid biosynthesis-associated methylase [Ulvibacterium marinum]|uniref:Pseudaminic acid biosynthesis-associated methylase n=1 Tax=Ulvibacterium marinum TaxID=2419782 RepID=A0A3B0CAJ2_9FLAO|nr:pseudaminic acid biosynthesis-associated methylase [Ulvibacterium marinum]RKN82773.1 pseudaminic acid biosynthesis-associated methylase [Ulvibacterium marinum]
MNEKFKTPQEEFWAGEFGEEYIERNQGKHLLASNLNFFNLCLKQVQKPASILEFGANIGMNLKALKLLFPDSLLKGIEINKKAADQLKKTIGDANVFNQSIFDFTSEEKFDVAMIKGVLIHINPEMLDVVYEKLYAASKKHILIAEYYNPSPVTINYRGHKDRLFKRDFAGEMMAKYPSLQLADYGFSYRKDINFPQDDITWFLLKK